MAAYNSVASLAKAIDEIKNLFSVREYEESLKPINDYATSLLPFLEYSSTIRLRKLLRKAEEKMKYIELENDERISISIEKDVIEALLEDSERLNWWLIKDSEAKIISSEMRVRELANKANDSIQFFIGSIKSSAGRWSRFKLKRRMRKVGEEMKSIVGEIKMVMNMLTMDKGEISIVGTNSSSTFAPIDKLFGLDNDLKWIKRILLNYIVIKELLRFSIVGSGGSGKTSFARYTYNYPKTVKHFQIRLWVTVSQDYSRIDLLRNLLLSLGQIFDLSYIRLQSNSYKEMELLVKQLLYEKRYLIVMDDVYSTQVWDYAQSLFPDDGKGSRIILTTRNLDVAAYFCSDERLIYEMKLMDDDQSWYLLCNKVFGEQRCPVEFEPLGRKIARGCEGLPLSIVTMADLLSSIPMDLNLWKAISEDIISAICTKDSQLEKIMLWSFNELPHHLRQCLLYMGGFPKNHELGVPELIKLWVAEGFIKPNGSKTFEEVAEEYVEDLVKRNLVKVIGRNKNGKIKSYSLPNLVRDFCMRKIQEHKFLLPVMDYLSDTTLRRFFLPKCLKTQRRVILGSYDLHLKEAIDNSPMRTIICIKQGEYLPRASAQKFPLLRILHVVDKSDNLGWESDHIFELIHLRYLASNILSSSIPASISKLQNLQTLIIYRHNVHLPEEIWSLTRLRHLIAFSFHPLPHPKVATSPLQSLQTLSLASNFEISETIQKMIPNLKSLEICYSDDTSEQDYQLNNLANFHELENLKLEIHKDFCFGQNLRFPVQLKKISLSGCRLPWKDMRILGSLRSLEVLKLRNYAFQGDEWKVTGKFSHLKYLLIDESDLGFWSFSRHRYFRELVCLQLYRCPYLEDIPKEIGYSSGFELLEVDGGNKFLVKAAESILEEQHNMGNKSFRVQVKHF